MGGDSGQPLLLVAATERDVDAVDALYRACTAALLARGIQQWDDRHPDRATAAAAAARGELFLLVADGRSVGAVTLDQRPAPEYATIRFAFPGPALIVHALVIDPGLQGAGLGRAAMACCETYARGRGCASIQLDAYPGNRAALVLYERLGYERRGDVRFQSKPPGHERYAVYEKRL